MEGKLTKRRRIYSAEPKKIAQADFARIYLSHLVPALMELSQKKQKSTLHSSEEEEDEKNSCVNVVKHEVGMAMVCSAPPGFAWSKALKAKFQTDHTNVGIIDGDDGDNHHMNNAPSSPYNFSSNPTTGSSKSCVHDEEEEGLVRLRRLIPGGEKMGEDEEEMVRELHSYISCLQMQVNILQCLAQTTP